MLDSTVDLISQAASNSLLAFCFCNLIIAIILMGSKSSPGPDAGRVVMSLLTCRSSTGETPLKAESPSLSPSDCREERLVVEPEEVCSHCNIQIEDEGCDHEEEEDHDDGSGGGGDDDDDDDELRTRIEDFIAKVNREWHAEKLRAIAAS